MLVKTAGIPVMKDKAHVVGVVRMDFVVRRIKEEMVVMVLLVARILISVV